MAGGLKPNDPTLLTPSDWTQVTMEFFERLQNGDYKLRKEAALTFLQIAIDEVDGGASPEYDTLKKIEDIIKALPSGDTVEFDVENQTGQTITRGSVVYPDPSTIIGLADAYDKNKSRVIAVVKEEILDGEAGKVVKLGPVTNINTSSFTAGQIVYLGSNGQYSATPPDNGGYVCIVGVVDIVSTTAGQITVDTAVSDITVEATDTNGFPPEQREGTTLSYVDGTRTFTISPTGSSFYYYVLGDKMEQTGSVDIVWPDVEGQHWFYFDKTGLQVKTNPTPTEKTNIIEHYAFVAYVYWDFTNKKIIYDILDERHGINMPPVVHSYIHKYIGTQYDSGYKLSDILADQNGSLDTHAQFSVTAGQITDEDISHVYDGNAVGDTIEVAYLEGLGLPRIESQAGFAFLNAPSGRVYFNEFSGGVWSKTEASSGNFVLSHLFAMNGYNKRIVAIMGESQYSTLNDARDAASSEINNITSTFQSEEGVPVATFILETKDSYSNSVKARIRTIAVGSNYVDWTLTDLVSGGDSNVSSHLNLSDVFQAGLGVTQGHVNEELYNKIINNSALNKLDATQAPTVDNDVDEGYSIFSCWLDLTNTKMYVCFDATDGAAVWVDITGNFSGDYNDLTNKPDLSVYAEKTNVLELDNTDVFTPSANYHPATKKYVDDNAGGGGGSLAIQENGGTQYTEALLEILTNGETVLTNNAGVKNVLEFLLNSMKDYDNANQAALTLIQRNSSDTGFESVNTKQQEDLDTALPEVNIGDGESNSTLFNIGTLWLKGHTFKAWVINETANSITGFKVSDGTNDLFTPVDIPANGEKFVEFDMQYGSSVNDISLQGYATTWNGGTVTLRHTQIKN